MTKENSGCIFLVNPLPETLYHYEKVLRDNLASAAVARTQTLDSPKAEGVSGSLSRFLLTLRLVMWRLSAAMRIRHSVVVVLWPTFGYLDALTWLPLSVRNNVVIVTHDPSPLRKQGGHSPFAARVFALSMKRRNLISVCHTKMAAADVKEKTAVESKIVMHPVAANTSFPKRENSTGLAVIRVLGQFKDARLLEPLSEIAASRVSNGYRLEVLGRSWPEIEGWKVEPVFLPEETFAENIAESDCVVIPYSRFFQSGVAVRSLEMGRPVVAEFHEHIAELYGENWAGFVRPEEAWAEAVGRALSVTHESIRLRAEEAEARSVASWTALFLQPDIAFVLNSADRSA